MQTIVAERHHLDELISTRKRLIEQRRGIDQELHRVETALASFKTTPPPRQRISPKPPVNPKPLVWVIYDVLSSGYPMTVAEIVSLVRPLYRTKSPTQEKFTACVEKAIIRMHKSEIIQRRGTDKRSYLLSPYFTRTQAMERLAATTKLAS